MDNITIADATYPVRWDMLALKEYKALTKNDAIAGFEGTTENLIALVYVGIKGGSRLSGEKFEMKQDDIAAILMPKEIKAIVKVFGEQCGLSSSVEGELKPS
jgi:hypothetical protein